MFLMAPTKQKRPGKGILWQGVQPSPVGMLQSHHTFSTDDILVKNINVSVDFEQKVAKI